MDFNNNTTIIKYRSMVNAFEKYESLFVDLDNLNLDLIHEQQLCCLASIESMIWDENDYFESLYNLHEDITNQIKYIQTLQNQLTINDITIVRIDPPITEPLTNTVPVLFKKTNVISDTTKKDITNEENVNKKLIHMIQTTLILPNANGLIDISGLKREKHILKEAIVYPILYPQLFTGNRKTWNTALLYGPPGTGKTQLAHCLAAEVQANFYNVSSADLLSSYLGESEKLMKILFQYCQQGSKHSVIFIDEIDGLCRTRNSTEKGFERRIKNELLNQLSSIDKHPNNKIFLLACTNCPWDLDSAFIRRFQRRIYISLPDRETRKEMFQNQLKFNNNLPNESELNEILDRTEGWSGSDITDLIKCAENQPLKDLETATHWIITADNKYMPTEKNCFNIQKNIKEIPPCAITVRSVEIKDYFTAFNEITKTVTNENLDKFEKFNQSYGTCKTKK